MADEGSYLPLSEVSLYYKLIGDSGPLLVLIPVSNGTTLFYESLASYLAPYFRILLYDRRGYHRSRTDNRPNKEDLFTIHASDVAALIEHVSSSQADCESEPAFVFTSSASSGVATELLINHPHLVHTIVLHEPAFPALLPSAAGMKVKQKVSDISSKAQVKDIRAANAIIDSLMYADAELQLLKTSPVFARVPTVFNLSALVYYLTTEISAARDYLPDLVRLKGEAVRGKVKIVLGRKKTGMVGRVPGEILAGVWGVGIGLAPGGHVGYVTDAREFAEYLRRLLAGGEARL